LSKAIRPDRFQPKRFSAIKRSTLPFWKRRAAESCGAGLAYDWSDISVLTNISEDHIGQDGIESVEDLIPIKALIAERVRAGGTLILNADDENSLRVLEREKVKQIDKTNRLFFT
jgi:UDP-N-acetylmuramate-alanine ligase